MSALIGRGLQLVGMAVLPVGLYIGMVRGDIQTEVRLLTIGGILYLVGWLISKKEKE